MIPPALQFDEVRTACRIRALERYYDEHVLSGRKFVCPSFRDCKASLGPGLKFYYGQLSHVGKRYDVRRNGKDLRIVVCGLEYGRPPSKVAMDRRYEMVVRETGIGRAFYKDSERENRNPHMRGTTLMLKRTPLGGAAVSQQSFNNWYKEFIARPHIAKNHIFNMFSLVNFLLCSAVQGDTQGRSTRQMRDQCAEHYLETLRILDPNLVVLQGKNGLDQVLRALELSESWRKTTETLGRFQGEGLDFVTCNFTHPAARSADQAWAHPNRPYFRSVVLPTLRRALRSPGVED